ncbi:hypothetical protein [Kitasatospora sp. GP82]|uniref:hypothetical protein n=1 Tax=Kitasatospora sp. GP82 TaxID=3035089 RepID=UPI002474E440|nr:hypothetical protein [Kitasatospora sp. GP82]MDH6124049.1 hypothetical protein [Kitasatospora sp. GP82]
MTRTLTADQPTAVAGRYTASILRLHERLHYPGLLEAVRGEPLHHHDHGDGLVTLAVRDSQLPLRYLRGILGFRLAQYLRLGWICPSLVQRAALFHEPFRPAHGVEDVHIVTLSAESGRILGYVGLSGSYDPEPLPLDAPGRPRLATELAHRIDLLGPYAAPELHTHHAFEVKRFLRDQSMPPGALASLVPWHIVLGFGRSLLALGGPQRRMLAVGDAKEEVAIRHLTLMGLDLTVVDGTSPSLPRSELMWPIYEQDTIAKPFVGRLPEGFRADMDTIETYLTEARGTRNAHALVEQLARRRKEATQP